MVLLKDIPTPKRKAQEEEEGERDGWGFAVLYFQPLKALKSSRGKRQEARTRGAQTTWTKVCYQSPTLSQTQGPTMGLSEEVPRRIP